MGEIFSKALQNFYTRKGNRIIFRSNLTLNQLALEMSEKLHFREIDASVVSRVLKGERIFTQQQLSIFCQILKLDANETRKLKRTLHLEFFRKYEGRYLMDLEMDQFVDMVDDSLNMIQQANQSGFSVLALDWSKNLVEKTRQKLNGKQNKNLEAKLLTVIYRLLEQESISILRREMPDNAYKAIWGVLKEMLDVANYLKDPAKAGLVYAKMGDTLNLVGGIHNLYKPVLKTASEMFQKSLKLTTPSLKFYPLAYAMLNESYLGNQREFAKLLSDVYLMVPRLDLSNTCELYNLIAKSKVSIGIVNGLERDFINGWSAHKDLSDKSPSSKIYRGVQLARTEVQSAISGYWFRNKKDLKKIAIKGLYAAKNFGYRRYFLTTKSMIKNKQEELDINVFV